MGLDLPTCTAYPRAEVPCMARYLTMVQHVLRREVPMANAVSGDLVSLIDPPMHGFAPVVLAACFWLS